MDRQRDQEIRGEIRLKIKIQIQDRFTINVDNKKGVSIKFLVKISMIIKLHVIIMAD